MNLNRIKLLTILLCGFLFGAFFIFQSDTIVRAKTDGDIAADYKAKCAMCHSAKAEKFFDPAKSVDVLKDVILKGNKNAKPSMPDFSTKGMTAEQAKAFAEYMVSLRKPADTNTNTAVNAANTQSNTVANTANTAPTLPKIDEQTIAFYKSNCLMCHSPKAEKSFDPSKAENDYVQTILKGKKTDKPPVMPAFETKINADQAKALAFYMRKLRICDTPSAAPEPTPTVVPTATPTPAPQFNEQTIASYKSKCAMCHGQKSEKAFNPTKTDEVLMNVVLKGNKTAKPPMPAFEEKGIKFDEAKALLAYMRSLKS